MITAWDSQSATGRMQPWYLCMQQNVARSYFDAFCRDAVRCLNAFIKSYLLDAWIKSIRRLIVAKWHRMAFENVVATGSGNGNLFGASRYSR